MEGPNGKQLQAARRPAGLALLAASVLMSGRLRFLRGGRLEAQVLRGWLWVVLWIGAISLFSSAEFSAASTSRLFEPILRWLFAELSSETLLRLHFFIRKAAHLIEYGVLALLALRAFLLSSAGPPLRNYAATLALVLAVAGLDETLQTFSTARTGAGRDVALDLVGAAAALGIFLAVRHRRGRSAPAGVPRGNG